MSEGIALVHAYLQERPEETWAWVRGYSRVNYTPRGFRVSGVQGHYRRKDHRLQALRCVCKFEPLVTPDLSPPPDAVRMRHDDDGSLIPRNMRVFIWV